MSNYYLEPIDTDDVSACDLRRAMDADGACSAWRVRGYRGEYIDMGQAGTLVVWDDGTAGLEFGADSDWFETPAGTDGEDAMDIYEETFEA